MNKKSIISTIAVVFLLGGLFWLGSVTSSRKPATPIDVAGAKSESKGPLLADVSSFDFGSISMAKGNVSNMVKVKNIGSAPITVNKIYTSCMCTSASVTMMGKKYGTFGMPGHGGSPSINLMMRPNEEMEVNVTFDPNAHGPAGVGTIERQIFVENSAGDPIVINFKAVVTP